MATHFIMMTKRAARASPFGELIASGTHTLSLMLAAVVDHTSSRYRSLGLESSARMLRPVRAGDTASIEWEVVAVTHSARPKGWTLTLSGQLVPGDGVVALRCECKSLVY
jgi:3-hydroxybutyryl-CoA dehydratase